MGWKAKTGRWLLTHVVKPVAETLIKAVKDDETKERRARKRAAR